MTVLGIETATMVCGAALVRDGHVIAEEWVEERAVHAERLFELIDGVLSAGKCLPRELDALAVSIGPGSFTGLRIGLSAVKGFHMALGIPIVAVPTLTALARRGSRHFAGRRGHIVVALDARRDEVYSQLFAVEGGRILEREGVQARTVRDLLATLPEGALLLTGDARQKVAALLHERHGTENAGGTRRGSDAASAGNGGITGQTRVGTSAEREAAAMHGPDGGVRGGGEVAARPGLSIADTAHARCSAAEIALMGEEMALRQEYADPTTLEPLYVKEVFLRSLH